MRSSLSFPPSPRLFSFPSSRNSSFSSSLSLSLKFSFLSLLLFLSLYSPSLLLPPPHLPSFALALFEAPRWLLRDARSRRCSPIMARQRESWRETGRLSRVLPNPEGGPRAFRRRLRNRGVSLRKLCDVSAARGLRDRRSPL